MKKLLIYAVTAVAVMAAPGIAPATAYAATNTYDLPGGNGKVVVIGGGSMGDVSGMIGQISGNINSDCDVNFQGFPGIQIGGGNITSPIFPDMERPNDSDQNRPNTDTNRPNTDTNLDAFADQVVSLVNQERAKAGLSPLTVNRSVVNAAQTRAKEITSSFSHTRPDGKSFSTALTEAGVNYRGSGENIAYGQKSPEEVMNGWMNSSGHRANILNASFTQIGVGHYRSAAGVDYWTQLFIN